MLTVGERDRSNVPVLPRDSDGLDKRDERIQRPNIGDCTIERRGPPQSKAAVCDIPGDADQYMLR